MVFEKITTISAKGQTTVPVEVRNALGVDAGDRVSFRLDDEGKVSLSRAEDDGDPAIDAFLTFLAQDIQTRPAAIAGLTEDLKHRLEKITVGTTIGPDDVIEGDVGL
jgi:antitoxin PrlF